MNVTQTLAGARLKTDAAATYLGISGSKLAKMRAEGKGPKYRRIGASVDYDKADLDSFLEAAKVDTQDTRSAA